jgi:hypothetical protein
VLRRYGRFAPEGGAGLVVSDVFRPTYGTTKNAAGDTVVGLTSRKKQSYDAAIMLNLVCRCGWGTQAAPILQVGASANVNAPGVMLGAGLRLFTVGKGNLALGAGALFAWTKDLTDLHIGDKVAGTADIEADLSFKRQVRPYVAFLYNF